MKQTLYKIDKVEWYNPKTNDSQIWYAVEFYNIDDIFVISQFDTEEEAEEYLVQQIAIKQSFKVK